MRQANLPLNSKKPLPSVTLLHGDCLEIMPTLPAKSVQMVFADLPYGALKCAWDSVIELRSMWQSLQKVTRSGAAMCFTSAQPFTTALIQSNISAFKYDLVWCKGKGVGHALANRRPLRIHESVLIFASKQTTYNAQKTDGHPKLPRTCQAKQDKSYGIAIKPGRNDSDDTRHPVSILQFNSDSMRRRGWANVNTDYLHPTQKPVALLEWLIRTYTNEGDTVLDPVAGSGTTAIAAMRTGRHSICIEKDDHYFAVMQKRVADERARLESE